MRLLIQKQQQILKQNLSKFENRASQITYSLNKIQYLLIQYQENELNKEFIKNEYKFLQALVAQVGEDLNAFQNSASLIQQASSHNDNSLQLTNLQNANINIFSDQIKIEEDEGDKIKEKEINSDSNYDDIEDEDDDDEYEDQHSQQKSLQNRGVITRKKNIEKDKIYSSQQANRNISQFSNNYSSSISESQNYMGSSGGNKDQNSNNRQIRKKKYSEDLRKRLVEEVAKKTFSYRRICKKYNINYGTAYYLVNSIEKEMNAAKQQQNQEPKSAPGENSSVQKTNLSTNSNEAASSNNNNNNNKIAEGTNSVEKQSQPTTETGRAKYSEQYKQKLYVELSCGQTYKEISDKYNLSYETCYYLINTIKTQASKDSQLNKSLKAQIAQYKEQMDQNKTNEVSSKSSNNKQNTIPTTTTLTRAQQAILNGTSNLNEKKIEINSISIDDEDQDDSLKNSGEKKVKDQEINSNQNEKIKIETSQKSRSPKVLKEEDSNHSQNQISIEQDEEQGKIKEEHKLDQEYNHLNDLSSDLLKQKDKKNDQEQSLNGQNKDSQSSTKGAVSSDNE